MAKGSRVASCADYDSEEGEEVADSRKQANLGVANIAAKRSGGLGKDTVMPANSPQLQPSPDGQSDSGVRIAERATAGSEVNTVSSTTSSSARKSSSGHKKGKKCTDPNCKHRTDRGRSSKTSSITSPVKPTARSPPPLMKRSPQPRQASPKRRAPRPEDRPELRPTLRPRGTSASSQQRPRSYYAGMQYPIPPGQQVPPQYARGGPYPMSGGQMVVNRANHPGRPPMPHLVTDMNNHTLEMSARRQNPSTAYHTPVVIQSQKPHTILSARRPPKSSAKFADPFDDDEDEDEEEEEETESEEEEDPRAAFLQAAHAAKLQAKAREQHMRQQAERQFVERQAQAQAQAASKDNRRALQAAQQAKAEAERMAMPPPPRPATVVNGYNMRRPPSNATPIVTYGQSPRMSGALAPLDDFAAMRQALPHGSRPLPTPTGAMKAPSYPQDNASPRVNFAADQAMRNARRNSLYGDETTIALELREQRLIAEQQAFDREKQEFARRQRRESQVVNGYNPDAIRAQLRNPIQTQKAYYDDDEDEDDSDEIDDPRLNEAERYIKRNTKSTGASLKAGILRKSNPDEETATVRSRRSHTGSSATRRQQSIIDPVDEKYQGDGFKMRIDIKQDYEIEHGGNKVKLQPNADGTIDLYIAGKRETQYHTSKASSSSGSKQLPNRQIARRTRYIEEEESEEEEEDFDSEEERELRSERRSIRGGGARRRAETYSVRDDGRRRRDPLRAPSVDSRARRGQAQSRRPATPEQSRYPGPPLYGVPDDEYPRTPRSPQSQMYGRFDSQSPRSYGGSGQHEYQSFGA
ncbi:hypothetical protein BT63DRAFT_161700 [Microthyrium microscopicum]|uniref:Uncharacterized protein n=1 Tax=Microthyrium microscopicum TaxID=703497 RepID=A0A6A6URS3_9PEZI|nr:hypothetical protein BT63DRAFT_161700 [Microthyrium microscopicum]